MTKTFYWMVLICAWVSTLEMQSAEGSVDLVSAPERPLLSVTGADSSTVTAMSSTGRFVLFTSFVENLTTNVPNRFGQVYLRDRELGTTMLVSTTPEGRAANGVSAGQFVDDTGRVVLIQSDASDLAPNDGNRGSDVYMRDMPAGSVLLLSTNANGAAGNGDSHFPRATPDGLFVAFESTASDLVEGDTNTVADVFIRDMKTGVISLASRLPDGFKAVPQNDYELSAISTNGQHVLFTVNCTVVPNANRLSRQVFLRDTLAGKTMWISADVTTNTGAFMVRDCSNAVMTPDAKSFVFISMLFKKTSSDLGPFLCRHDISTGITTAFNFSNLPFKDLTLSGCVLSDDGRFAAYTESTGQYPGKSQVYRRDLLSGSKMLVSVGSNGTNSGNAYSDSPQISADGRFILFESTSSNIITQAISPQGELMLRDMDAGITRLVTASKDGLAGVSWNMTKPFLSANGKLVAFDSVSDVFVPGDANNETDVFVRDMDSDATELISVQDSRLASATAPGLNNMSSLGVSLDGRFIAFTTTSDGLATGDSNQTWDVFMRDTEVGSTRLVSWSQFGTGSQNNGVSTPPSISDNGRYVAFESIATNLSSLDSNVISDVYVRDLWKATILLVSKNQDGVSGGKAGSFTPIVSPGGDFLLFASKAPNLTTQITNNSGNQETRVVSIAFSHQPISCQTEYNHKDHKEHKGKAISNAYDAAMIGMNPLSPAPRGHPCFQPRETPWENCETNIKALKGRANHCHNPMREAIHGIVLPSIQTNRLRRRLLLSVILRKS